MHRPTVLAHQPVDVLRDDAQLGELAREGGESLVSGVGRLAREAHREVPEEELVVPSQGVPAEDGAPPLSRGGDGPDRIAAPPESGNACSGRRVVVEMVIVFVGDNDGRCGCGWGGTIFLQWLFG